MSTPLPRSAEVVIVGGGIAGCSVAYHLAKLGCNDVLLLERNQLTSGTTWHAAGLMSQVQANHALTELAVYGFGLLEELEKETGLSTGLKRCGSLAVAMNDDRMEELLRRKDLALCYGIEARQVTPSEIGALWPLMRTHGMVGGIHFVRDGQTNPVDTTMALARGARQAGATLLEGVAVTKVLTQASRVVGIETETASVHAELVVNCTGMWTREFAAGHGVHVPVHPNQHYYIVTDPVEGVRPELASVRIYDEGAYYKEEAGKLLIGFSEPNAEAWNPEGGIPKNFCFGELPYPEDHLTSLLELVMERVPSLQRVGIRKFFNGPESYTPDGRYVIGQVPELENYFVLGGFNSTGIQNGPGAGRALAEWIVEGRPTVDLADLDVRRFETFQANRDYLIARVPESLTLTYGMHWPYLQRSFARGMRRSPLHGHLAERNVVFGETAGWERPMWYAGSASDAHYRYAFARAPWFPCWEAEHRAVREDLGLIDLTPFGKLEVEGRDALAVLQRISANDVDVCPGRVVYTQWLNEQGGIEADLTLSRLAADRFLVVTSCASLRRDRAWLQHHTRVSDRVRVTDMTSCEAVLGLSGPRSREFLSAYSRADLSNAAFPFATWQTIDVGRVPVRAQRLSFQGELGWELFVSTELAAALFETLMSGEQAAPPRLFGLHASDSLRVEKAFRHWGHDMGSQESPLEAGLMSTCKLDKAGGFLGRDAVLRQQDRGIRKTLLQFRLQDPDAFLYHNEPILRGGEVVGSVTSASYGHSLGATIALGYVSVPPGTAVDELAAAEYRIMAAGQPMAATASSKPMYDPSAVRARA